MKLSIATYVSMTVTCHFSAEEAALLFPDAAIRANNATPTYVLVGGSWEEGFEFAGVPGQVKRWPDNVNTDAYRIYKVTFNLNPRFPSFASFPLSSVFYQIPASENNKRYDVPLRVIAQGHVFCNKADFTYDGPVHRNKFGKQKAASNVASQRRAQAAVGERQISAGALSARTSYRLLVTGPFRENEIDSLIARLQFEKKMLLTS
jgi:hypothetical protein